MLIDGHDETRSVDHEREQRLLCVEPVLGLIPDRRLLPVQHLRRDFLAVVGGKAVEDDRLPSCGAKKVGIDPVAGEINAAACVLAFVPHARPDVGVEGIRPGHGLLRVADELDRTS